MQADRTARDGAHRRVHRADGGLAAFRIEGRAVQSDEIVAWVEDPRDDGGQADARGMRTVGMETETFAGDEPGQPAVVELVLRRRTGHVDRAHPLRTKVTACLGCLIEAADATRADAAVAPRRASAGEAA
jgi:hypothetical protein